jgi:hypothetical protein
MQNELLRGFGLSESGHLSLSRERCSVSPNSAGERETLDLVSGAASGLMCFVADGHLGISHHSNFPVSAVSGSYVSGGAVRSSTSATTTTDPTTLWKEKLSTLPPPTTKKPGFSSLPFYPLFPFYENTAHLCSLSPLQLLKP